MNVLAIEEYVTMLNYLCLVAAETFNILLDPFQRR